MFGSGGACTGRSSGSRGGGRRFVRGNEPRAGVTSPNARLFAVTLSVWPAAVFFLGARGAFVAPPGAPPVPIVLGVVIPLLVAFAVWRFSPAFRNWVSGAGLRLLTGVQAWRFAGFGFLALAANGVLPGSFAWPAGLGDVAIGLTAPWLMLALIRRPNHATSRSFRIWNLLGILDLVVAIALGGANAVLATGIGGATSRPMATLPLVLIPAFLVPLFIMLHVAALIQARRLAGRANWPPR